MKTGQRIPAGGTTTNNFRGIPIPLDPILDTGVVEIKPPPRGVVQEIIDGAAGGSMSLGTRRLCNDRATPAIPTKMPVMAIEWGRITMYREPSIKPRNTTDQPPGIENLTRGIYNGYMSPATKRKFRRIASTWLRSIMLYRREIKRRYDPGRAYPTMITLTLPTTQIHSDREIYRACLMPWLQMMRRDYAVENYVWRAEAQENGNLHYHLIVDRYIPKRAIQYAWNQMIDNLGYRLRYFQDTGSLTPPTTEVHALKDQVIDKKSGELRYVDPVDYLIDYLLDVPVVADTEQESEGSEQQPRKLIGHYYDKSGKRCTYVTRPITGRVWGMSDQLRTIREPKAVASVPLIQALEAAKDAGDLRRIDLEHATMYFGKVSVVLGRTHPGAWAVIKQYYLQVFGFLYPDQLPQEYVRAHPPMDLDGLWCDLDNYGFHYPATRAEQIDAYNERNPNTEQLQIHFTGKKGYLSAIPELGYRIRRKLAKMARLGITDMYQRWVFVDRPSFG